MTVSDSSVLASAYLESAIYFSATALCCYDYCLTLGDEIQYVWTRKRPLSLLLFCGFRYPAVLNTIFVILGSRAWPGWQSNYSCLVLIRTEMVLNIVLLISAAVFTALRIYAIYGLKLSIFLIVFLLGIINPAIYMIYSLVALRPGLFTDGHIVFCASFSNSADRLSYMNWIIGARVSSLLADGLVLVLTWYKLFRVRSEAANACSTSLVSVLITDTGVYFLLLCIINIIGIGTGHYFDLIICLSTFVEILTSALLSRLLLDLHKSGEDGTDTSMDTFVLSTVAFSLKPMEDAGTHMVTTTEYDDSCEVELESAAVNSDQIESSTSA